METQLKRTLGLWDLIFMNIVAIVGLRWLLTAARTGYSSIFLWFLALVIFFIPQGYAVYFLNKRFPQEGGIYVWTREVFGPTHGFLAGWCYWINNLVYYPALLMFVAGNALFILGRHFIAYSDQPTYITLFSLLTLWFIVFLNIRGLSLSKWLHNLGGAGVWIPIGMLILLGIISWVKWGPAEAPSPGELFPDLGRMSTWTFWATMCFGFAGLELMSILGGEIRRPERNVPRAILISGAGITVVYILGTLALLVALPNAEVGLLSGIVQAIGSLSERFGVGYITPLAALFITLAGIGGLSAWVAGVARVPFVIGLDRYLPEALGRTHPRWNTPHVSLLVLGGLTSLFILISVLGATVEEAYLLLVEAGIILYFIPYLYMFGAAFRVSAGNWRGRVAGLLGFTSTFLSIVFALLPPEGVQLWLYELKLVGGCLVLIGIGMVIYRSKRPVLGVR